jgi:hypothetical protein
MMTFRNHCLRDFAVPMSTNWLLNDLAEAKGKQELYTRQSPQVLKALREMALVQSVESSNRIEGVTVAPDRLRPLVLGRACPGVSRDMIRLLLRDSKSAGRIECLGRGPGAKWRKRVTPPKEGNKPIQWVMN